MITPRQTRLYRAPHLRAFQGIISRLASHSDLAASRACAVIVPSGAAADQLRRGLEHRRLDGSAGDQAIWFPLLVTRAGWYDEMYARLPDPPRRMGDLEREVLLNAAARKAAEAGVESPFRLRAGLLAEMLVLYDDLRRRDATIDTFERVLARELERDADTDRGAERLLRQTLFLSAAYRGYEASLASTGGVDEHALRTLLLDTVPIRPLRQVVVTVGERTVDPAGLWPADLDLLTRLPLLERIDIVATQAAVASGLLDRLQKFMPGFEEADLPAEPDDAALQAARPVVAVEGPRAYSEVRDREDELSSIARKLAQLPVQELERRAIVFRRPLPYVYLARDVFADAGVPYQAFDALPLAAEPHAAALDLVFEFVTSNFTREPLVALLGCPQFTFMVDAEPLTRSDVSAVNRALADAKYFGGRDHLERIAAAGVRGALAAHSAAAELEILAGEAPPSEQLKAILAFLDAHETPIAGDALAERLVRGRTAVRSALRALQAAHDHLDDTPVRLPEVAAMIRRWIEGQTFSPRTGRSGVHLVDSHAARYGDFDEVFLVGLVDGEWPQRSAKSIFYPASLLVQLDWPDSRAALAGDRASFRDLAWLANRRVHFSTFELENDAIVTPSVYLDEIGGLGLASVEVEDAPAPAFVSEALALGRADLTRLGTEARDWLRVRASRSDAADSRFHGSASPHRPAAHAISSIERYLQCPFRFFAERVLGLEEDPEDELALNPKELGIFVHRVFETFFARWTALGERAITPANLPAARSLFADVVEPLLAALPADEAAVQRTRLLGSAADEGLAEAVFQAEAGWDSPIAERLLEFSLEGPFAVSCESGMRTVALRGKADRIDLLEDGTFRLIDYKLTRAPERKHALQLPIYTVCTMQQLRRTRGETWEPGLAGYIAFGQDREFVPMLARGKDLDATLIDAQQRLVNAIDRIERGEFPPTPQDTVMCTRCAYAGVCRKEYVGDV